MAVSGSPESFHTFCHISEFDADGYQSLRHMVAMSAPITLWAPASSFLNRPDSSVKHHEFRELIRRGAIKVLGRSHWLTDKAWRESKVNDWEGYAWDDSIDGYIRDIYEYDQHNSTNATPPDRVVAAGNAPGPHLVED